MQPGEIEKTYADNAMLKRLLDTHQIPILERGLLLLLSGLRYITKNKIS